MDYTIGEYQKNLKALMTFTDKFSDERASDREIAIVGVSYLESVLEEILRSFFVDDKKYINEVIERICSKYSSNVKLLYSLGLIPVLIRDDLELLGRIRNDFAHNVEMSFADARVSATCQKLKWHISVYATPPADATSRELFQVGLNQVVCYLSGAVSIARGEKRKVRL